MTPQDILITISDSLEKESRRHMEIANDYVTNDAVFSSRMAAMHVLGSLNTVVLALAKELLNAERN